MMNACCCRPWNQPDAVCVCVCRWARYLRSTKKKPRLRETAGRLGGSCPRMPAHGLLGEAGQIGREGVDRCVPRSRRARGALSSPSSGFPGVLASDRRSLHLAVYGASPQRLALCCDATLVSRVTSEGVPHPRAEHTAGVALLAAERRKHATWGGQRLCVLAAEVGGRWRRDAHEFVGTALGAPWLPRAAVRQEPPGSSPGVGGADRPQLPANALSMVLTALSSARCSGQGAVWWKK